MILAIDVYYLERTAKAVGVLFDWDDSEPRQFIEVEVDGVEDYLPGQFYKRELPCLLKVIDRVDAASLEAIVVDGHVYVNETTYGLGGKLYEALGRSIPVIGVGKNAFHANSSTVRQVFRGGSSKPLYVSAIGTDADSAADRITNMYGKYRFPDILKQLDTRTKTSKSN